MHHYQVRYDHNQPRAEKSDPLLHETYSRRALFRRIASLSAAGLLLAGLLAACGNENNAEGSVASEACDGNASLSLSDMANRRALGYVDESSHTEKTCSNCQFFTQPGSGAQCGGCQIVSGQIAPAGYCDSWVTNNV